MKHFEIEQWLDFVRGLAGETEGAAMKQHLAQDCKKCRARVKRLSRFVKAVAADASYQVPDRVATAARAIFVRQRPEKISLLPRLVARLVFDSFREPALAGIRSGEEITHQAMYEAGDYCVDLRIEQEPRADTVALVGQIANRTQPEQRVSGVPVILMSGKEIVRTTVSNASGEFQIECEVTKSLLRLHVPLERAGKQIEVPLKNFFATGKKTSTKQPRKGRP